MHKPRLYFLGGAGGNWINYVTWCGLNQTTWDYNFVNFHASELKAMIPGYDRYYEIVSHHTPREFADVRLGSNRALINFYINVEIKNPSWTKGSVDNYIKTSTNPVFAYNLDYADIFFNPESFLSQLKNLSGFDICLDQHTQKAIAQYRRSCPWTNLTFDELAVTPLVQQAWKYCFEHMTNPDLPVTAREEQAWHTVRQHLLVVK